VYVIGLVEHPTHVCCRYRLKAFKPYLENQGHRLELRAIPRGLWARLRLWWSVRDADAVILQRKLLAGFHLTMLRRNARKLIFDFDDAIFRRDSFSTKKDADVTRLRRFVATLHGADRVVAGNDFLRRESVRFVNAERVHLVPTCVEPRDYPLARHRRAAAGVQLVWIGSASTLQGLDRQRPLFDIIGKHVPGVRLKVICDVFPRFKRLPLVPTPWSQETEAAELASADIGVSWTPPDQWSLGKCGLKVLQYMAAGLPVVANSVGVQALLVRHGETGFLAQTPAEWVQAIRTLAADTELRQRMGRAGRQLVEREYSVDRGADAWLRILEGLSPLRQRLAA
jgi:glycosyltransferase involved in cell wall biosynthesis